MAGKRQMKSLSTWGGAHPRLKPEVWPVVSPSFQIPAGAKIFTIGSCFARNVEKNLATLKMDLPTLNMRLPEQEWAADDNSFLNRYTPQTIWQDIAWTAELHEAGGYDEKATEKYAIELDDGKVIDTGFPLFVPVTRGRFHERRRELFEVNRQMFSADAVTITLGLVESWYDTEGEVWLHSTPLGRPMLKLGDRFRPERTGMVDCLRYVDEAVTTVRRLNSDVKMLITTSPVALARTFTDEDIITANMYSKSVLRAVATEVVARHERTDYFPSYESAMLTRTWDIWDPDLLHLKKSFISKIVSHLVGYYCGEVDAASVLYQKSFAAHLDRDYEAAAEAIHAALEQAPEDVEMLRHAAMVEQTRKNAAASADLLERATKLEPTAPNWLALGMARMRALDKPGAQDAFREAVKLMPENHAARYQLAKAMMAVGDEAGAEQHLRHALEANPRRRGMHVDYAKIALRAGHHDAAIERALKAVQVAPPKHKETARYVIGKAYLEMGDVEKARQYAYADDGSGSNTARALEPLRKEIEALEQDTAAEQAAAVR